MFRSSYSFYWVSFDLGSVVLYVKWLNVVGFVFVGLFVVVEVG